MSNHTTAAGYFVLRGQQRIKAQPLVEHSYYCFAALTIELPFDVGLC